MVSVRDPVGEVQSSRLQLALAALLVAAVAASFSPSLGNGFVSWDDQWYVVDNDHLKIESLGDLLWPFTHSYYWSYIPLTLLSHALDYALWGRDPFGHHLTSLVLHAANAVWLFVLSVALLRVPQEHKGSVRDYAAIFGAFAGALLFAVHPLRVESVAWVSDRKDVLCAFFLLPALLAYLRSRSAASVPSGRRWLGLSVGLFVCALLSKATALMFPVVLLLLERALLDRGPEREPLRTTLRRVAPFAAGSVVVGLIGLASTPAQSLNFLILDLSETQRMLLPFHTIVSPLGTLFWPTTLGPIYDYPEGVLTLLLSLLIVLLVTGATVILARMKYPAIALAWAIYLVMSLPTALFFLTGIQPLADRYTYLSLMSIMVLAGAGAMLLVRRAAGALARILLVAALAAAAIPLGVMTHRQAEIWKNSLTLWSHAVRVAPSSAVAFNNLGQAHLEAGAVEEGMLAFTVASRLKPDYADVYNNMGVASIMAGDARGGRRLLEQARVLLEGVPSSGPDLPDVYRNLGRVHYELGDLDSALVSYRSCLALQPQDGLAWNGLAEVLEAMGYAEESLRATERAARLGNPDALQRRAQVRGEKGEIREDPP